MNSKKKPDLKKEIDKKENTKNKTKKKSGLRENVEAIIVAIILALFIRTFIVQAFKIPSGSMKDTLLIGDHILVNKFIYGVKIPFMDKTIIPFKDPEHDDIVVFKFPLDPKKDFIKRVVGVAGDVIECHDKKVYVNGKLQNHDFVKHEYPEIIPGNLSKRDNFGPLTVPPDSIFVMGDNRDNSHDGRFWGFVNLKAVKGKAFIIYWSWDKGNFGVRWRRIGDILR